MNLAELERLLDRLDEAGLLEDDDKEDDGWAEFVKTVLEDVNGGKMDAYVFIIMKMFADYKRACDLAGRVLPNPATGAGLDMAQAAYQPGIDQPDTDTSVAEDETMLAVDVDDLPAEVKESLSNGMMINSAAPIRRAVYKGESYFTHNARKYSKNLATKRYFVYPESGSFRILRGHVARIDVVNKTRMEVTMLTGAASDPTHYKYGKYHKVSFPFSLLPDSYYEGMK